MFSSDAHQIFQNMLLKNGSPILLVSQDEGMIVGANIAACKFYGRAQDEITGLGLDELTVGRRAVEMLQGAMDDIDEETGLVNPLHARHLCNHGKVRHVEISPSTIEIASQTILMLIVQDITKRVQAEQALQDTMSSLQRSKNQLSMSQQISHIGSWEWDMATNRIFWSDETYRIYGIAPGTPVTYDDYQQHIHPDDRARCSRNVRMAIEDRGSFEHYHRLLLPDGSSRVVFGQGYVVVDKMGEPLRLYGTCHDVTQQRQLEEKLVNYTIELEESHRSLEQFACVASHDLKEPLRKINAFSDRLLSKYGDNLDERGQDYLVRIQKASARMGALVEDLLSFSRLRASEVKLQEVDLNTIFQGVLEDMDLCIEENHAIVELDPLPIIHGDPARLRQLFQNLLGNALKFTMPHRQPHLQIRARYIRRDTLCNAHLLTDAVELRISDNGVGFDPHHAERMFAPFQRLHDKKQYTGTGMGLAICRTIVEQHRGHIHAEGVPSHGATFIIHLPCEDEEFMNRVGVHTC